MTDTASPEEFAKMLAITTKICDWIDNTYESQRGLAEHIVFQWNDRGMDVTNDIVQQCAHDTGISPEAVQRLLVLIFNGEDEELEQEGGDEQVTVMSFDNSDDMFAYMAQQEEQANARITPEQASIVYGSYWMRVMEDFLIFGYVPTEDEIRASELEEGGSVDEVDNYTLPALRDSYARGYRYGRAYSVVEPDGEWGSTHIANMVKITAEQFQDAKLLGYDPDVIFGNEDNPALEWAVAAFHRAVSRD